MTFKFVTSAFAVIASVGLLAAPASAAPKKRVTVADARGATVYTSRDEDGRTRTRVIIQRRSYLDPGTEVQPGSRHDRDYATSLANGRATSVLNNTAFGSSQSPLPGPNEFGFGKNSPFLRF
jgi:hypothetical protein